MSINKDAYISESGFSLVELMVGLVLGLFATLVIMQTFSSFEGQKRGTSGTADAQTNGSIALMNIQRRVQLAGYGLPLPNADYVNNSLRCDPLPADFDPDNNTSTLNSVNLPPISIQNGTGSKDSDTITVRYSTTAAGAIPVRIINSSNATTSGMNVVNNIGCNDDDIALVYNGPVCQLVKVKDANGLANTTEHITLDPTTTTLGAPIEDDAQMACMGNWQNYAFSVSGDELQLNSDAIVSDVVHMQAQYGVSAVAASNQVTSWVDATGGTWTTPSLADRNRIKAIRVTLVVRNGLREKENVSEGCTGSDPDLANVCIWNSDTTPQAIDLSGTTDWQKYRYRVFETIIPLRNVLWSKEAVT